MSSTNFNSTTDALAFLCAQSWESRVQDMNYVERGQNKTFSGTVINACRICVKLIYDIPPYSDELHNHPIDQEDTWMDPYSEYSPFDDWC